MEAMTICWLIYSMMMKYCCVILMLCVLHSYSSCIVDIVLFIDFDRAVIYYSVTLMTGDRWLEVIDLFCISDTLMTYCWPYCDIINDIQVFSIHSVWMLVFCVNEVMYSINSILFYSIDSLLIWLFCVSWYGCDMCFVVICLKSWSICWYYSILQCKFVAV